MKLFLLIAFLIASITGYSDSKTDTTIVPKKTSGSVIVTAPSGNVTITSGATNGTSGVTITSGSTSGQTLLNGSSVKVQTYATGAWRDRLSILNGGNVGIGNTAPTNLLSIGPDPIGQTNALMSIRNTSVFPNALEWGHQNTSGYHNTLGFQVGGGQGFIGFATEAGTNMNTYRTRGAMGTAIISHNGRTAIATVDNANADNQTATERVIIDSSGIDINGGAYRTSNNGTFVTATTTSGATTGIYGAANGTTNTTSCDTLCSNERASHGLQTGTNSICLGAWSTGGGAVIACSNTDNMFRHCLCAARKN